MAYVLLTSERFVKDVTSVSDNLAGKFLLPSIREVQDTRLREVVGSALLQKVKDLVADGTIGDAGNAAYKELLDRAQYFLAYAAVSEVAMKVSRKVANAGVIKTTDENVQPADAAELARLRDYYTFKADAQCAELQRWLLANRAALPELTEAQCHSIRATLHSAASTGLFLGGARGKILPGGGGCCI